MWHTWRRLVLHTGFWQENQMERNHLDDPGVDRRIILKWVLNRRG
jgi:hypothetical protein